MTERHEHDPDPAALDELRGAFGTSGSAGPEPVAHPVDPVPDEPESGDPLPDDLLIVEQTPERVRPKIIRIDDYAGSHALEEEVPATSAGPDVAEGPPPASSGAPRPAAISDRRWANSGWSTRS